MSARTEGAAAEWPGVPDGKLWNDPKSVEGRANGFGWCLRCGGTWNWRSHCVVPITRVHGGIALCLECALPLDADEIVRAMERLDAVGERAARAADNRPFMLARLNEWREKRQRGEDPLATMLRLHPLVVKEAP